MTRFDLFRDVADEQNTWSQLAREQRVSDTLRQQTTPEHATQIGDTAKRYPWMSPGVNTALAKSGATPQQVAQVAQAEADAKAVKKPGKKSFWSKVGDVVHDVGTVTTYPIREAVGTVQDAFGAVDRAVPVLGAVDAATAKYGKGATRVADLTAKSGYEAAVGAGRTAITKGVQGFNSGGGLYLGPPTGATSKEVADQTTAGQVLNSATAGRGVHLGSGFFASGEAAKQQAKASRDVLSIDGHAATPGRLAATVLTEPGTKPYTVLSGLIDAGATWFGDPANRALTAAGKAHAAEKVFANAANEADVARAAVKATPEWRRVIEESAGMVDGPRKTVVPAAVDKWLYSGEARKVTEKLTETSSPTEIWRAFDKKIDPELAAQLAQARDPRQVVDLLRPHLGVDMTKPSLNPLTGDIGSLGMQVVSSAQQQLRTFNVLPSTWLPWDDSATFVRNLDNTLANAKVNGPLRNAILDEAFRTLNSPSAGRQTRLLNTASKAIEESLKGYGVDEQMAKQLTSWTGQQDKIRRFLTDDLGNNVNFDFLVDAEGKAITAPRPAAIIDMLNSGAFLTEPDKIREVRSLTSGLRPITQNRGFKFPLAMVDFFTNTVWKSSVLPRAAFFARVNGEEVVRSLASGNFNSLWDYLNFAAFHRGDTTAVGGLHDLAKEANGLVERLASDTLDASERATLTGRLSRIDDELAQGKQAFDEVRVGREYKHLDFHASEKNLIRSGNWNLADKNAHPFEWRRGMGDEAIAMNQDPILRRVANGGLFEGDKVPDARPGLDGIKDWLTKGTGRPFLRKFENAYPGVDFTSEAVLDDIIAKSRMRVDKLGPDLRSAVADGKFNGAAFYTKTGNGGAISQEFNQALEQWRLHPDSPGLQKVEQLAQKQGIRGAADEALDAKDTVLRFFFGHLYGKTSDYLARSPVFKAEYWNRVDELMPHLTAEARTEVLANAEQAGLGRTRLASLRNAANLPAGDVVLEHADGLAKGWALDHTRQLLYDASERSQFSDITRAVFPFAEAWREVIGRWMRLSVQNPQIPRRATQIVEGARGAGFFHRDPATGQEMFTYPLDGWMADHLGVKFQGSVAGLSLGTSVMPGLGPVAAVAVNQLLPDVPNTDFIRQILFPYGKPGSVLGSVAPPWLKKAIAAWQGDPNKDRIYGNTYFEVMRQLVATGNYGTNPDEQQRLLNDASGRARVITGVRALAQFFAPSAPQLEYIAKTDEGDVVAALLVKDFHDMQAKDYDTAIPKFLDKYGDNALQYMIGKTRSTVGGQQASTEYGAWERQNGDLISKYPDVAGYFGPQGEGFNPTVFSRQEGQGKRQRRTAKEALDDGQSLVAGWVYRQLRDKIDGSPTAAQSEWLAKQKAAIQKEFPAWNPDAIPFKLPGRIRQLEAAKDDPKIANTDLGSALDVYFQKRSQAIGSAKASGLSSPFTSKRTTAIRDWLRTMGTAIAERVPEFQRVWDEVLSHEMKDDTPNG